MSSVHNSSSYSKRTAPPDHRLSCVSPDVTQPRKADEAQYSVQNIRDLLSPGERLALFRRTPIETSVKTAFAFTIILALLALIHFSSHLTNTLYSQILVCGMAAIGLGFVYAHVAEFQHELLHGHAFSSSWINRLLGFFCGRILLIT